MNNENQVEVRAARREYMRRWRSEHPESVKAAQMRFWAKKAAEMKNNQDEKKEQNQ